MARCNNSIVSMFIEGAWLIKNYEGCNTENMNQPMNQPINMTMEIKNACDNTTSCFIRSFFSRCYGCNLNILMQCDDPDLSTTELTTQGTTLSTENIDETTITEFTKNIETTTSNISLEVTENESTENNVTPSNSLTDSTESDISTVHLTEILTTDSTMHTPTRMSGGIATSPMLIVLTGKTSTTSYSIPLETATFQSISTKQISRSTDLTSRRKITTTRQTTTRLSIPSSPVDTPKPSTQRSTKHSVGTASPEKSSEISIPAVAGGSAGGLLLIIIIIIIYRWRTNKHGPDHTAERGSLARKKYISDNHDTHFTLSEETLHKKKLYANIGSSDTKEAISTENLTYSSYPGRHNSNIKDNSNNSEALNITEEETFSTSL